MKTTNYILELIISGYGAIIGLCLLLLVFIPFPKEQIEYLISNEHSETFLLVLMFILFPFVYIVGIVYDRFVDIYLDKFFYHKYGQYFIDNSELVHARSIIYIHSEPIKELFEYSKVRIRILRTWIVSSFFIAIMLPLSVTRQFQYFDIDWNWNYILLLVFLMLFFFLNSIITFRAWRNLARRECYLIKTQSELIRNMSTNGKD